MSATTKIETNDEINSFLGQQPFGVEIDNTAELQALIEKAEQCQGLPFNQKISAVATIALKAMDNAYEGWRCEKDPEKAKKYEKIVIEPHSLGEALKERAGCCRYQATLFLVLGAAAKLGDKHYLHSIHLGGGLNTCFNHVIHEGKTYPVSIFTISLKDKNLNYSSDSNIYNHPAEFALGRLFPAYTVTEGVVRKYARVGQHFDSK